MASPSYFHEKTCILNMEKLAVSLAKLKTRSLNMMMFSGVWLSKQAEMLALANSMGELSLALRSIADLNADKNFDATKKKPVQESTSINILRYGVKGRAYGVN